MTPVADPLVTAPLTSAELRVWMCLDPQDWQNREDLMVLAGVRDQEAAEACERFFKCGLLVRRSGYPDFRYRVIAIPDSLKTERARLLLAKLQAAMSAEAVV